MNYETPYILFYTANLAFILTNIYGWILKGFYRSTPYKSNFDNLFPSQRAVAALYMMQFMELPYLLMIGKPEALFYVNTFSLLLFSSLMVVMCQEYFFFQKKTFRQMILHFSPAAIPVIYLLLVAIGLVKIVDYTPIFWIVCIIFLYYVVNLVVIQLKIRHRIRQTNEMEYSNDDDFPIRFAQSIEWVPISICILMLLCFVYNDVYIKMWRDIIFTFVNVWFLIYTLDPHRKNLKPMPETVKNQSTTKHRLSAERCKDIERLIVETMRTEKLFLDSHLTIDAITQKLNTNKNYLSEALSRSEWGSFYSMINSMRIEYAIELLKQNPQTKIEYIAYESGFSSASIFSQVFKRYKGVSPTQYINLHTTDK